MCFVAITLVGLAMGYFILSKCYPDNLLFQIRIHMTPIQQLQVFSCSFQGSAFFEEAQISSPKSLRKSLRESKACLEFLAKIPLQSLVRERASDGKVAWLSLGGGVFLGSLCESVCPCCAYRNLFAPLGVMTASAFFMR